MTPESTLSRQTALAISPEEFRKLAHELVDRIAGHLETLPTRPVTRGESPDEIRALLHSERPLPAAGEGRERGPCGIRSRP